MAGADYSGILPSTVFKVGEVEFLLYTIIGWWALPLPLIQPLCLSKWVRGVVLGCAWRGELVLNLRAWSRGSRW